MRHACLSPVSPCCSSSSAPAPARRQSSLGPQRLSGTSPSINQYLWSPRNHPNRGIGVFFPIGASDGNPNPVKPGLKKTLSSSGQLVDVNTAVVSSSPPLVKEGQGGFAAVCSKRDVHKSPSIPLFQRGRPVHRRKPTGSDGASCRGLLYFVLALALRAGLRGPRKAWVRGPPRGFLAPRCTVSKVDEQDLLEVPDLAGAGGKI